VPVPFIRIELEIDADQNNADWMKRFSWDFPEFPETESELDRFIEKYLGVTPEHFRSLPVYHGWRYKLGKLKAEKRLKKESEG